MKNIYPQVIEQAKELIDDPEYVKTAIDWLANMIAGALFDRDIENKHKKDRKRCVNCDRNRHLDAYEKHDHGGYDELCHACRALKNEKSINERFRTKNKDVKRCSKCKMYRHIAEFPPCKKAKDGKFYYCNACQHLARKEILKKKEENNEKI